MHKNILNLFNFLKSAAQFIKIVIVFFILLHLLFWIQNLTGNPIGFLKPFIPILSSFLFIGTSCSKESIDLLGAKFEFSYIIALFAYLVLYLIDHLAYRGLEIAEEAYNIGYRKAREAEENAFNKKLAKDQSAEQRALKRYNIFVSTSIKPKFSHQEQKVNLEEQNKIMNKFLIEKTGVSPISYNGGFLYSFENFSAVDNNLQYFFKLLKSSSPLDYVICIQILGKDLVKEDKQLKELISLKFVNKVSACSDTVYRYRFNTSHRYETSLLGLFQKDGETFEVHEFREMI